MKLTQQQLEQFDREGYLFLPSAEEATFLKGEAEAIYQSRKEVWRAAWPEQPVNSIGSTLVLS